MARTIWNNGDNDTCLRRFNPRGPPYSISNDRYLTNLPHSDEDDRPRQSGRGYPVARENTHDVESEQESHKTANNRRRIPVAVSCLSGRHHYDIKHLLISSFSPQ